MNIINLYNSTKENSGIYIFFHFICVGFAHVAYTKIETFSLEYFKELTNG